MMEFTVVSIDMRYWIFYLPFDDRLEFAVDLEPDLQRPGEEVLCRGHHGILLYARKSYLDPGAFSASNFYSVYYRSTLWLVESWSGTAIRLRRDTLRTIFTIF